MNSELLTSLIGTLLQIVNDHLRDSGQAPLTDADAAKLKDAAYAKGTELIADWYRSKGLPVPD